jgi:hypothetical protein
MIRPFAATLVMARAMLRPVSQSGTAPPERRSPSATCGSFVPFGALPGSGRSRALHRLAF